MQGKWLTETRAAECADSALCHVNKGRETSLDPDTPTSETSAYILLPHSLDILASILDNTI